ncbi:MAG: hypothetical protein Q8Q59_10445 [Luteolibacter sp.]|nr:hypothetical protein [Luteolibacter sp.]
MSDSKNDPLSDLLSSFALGPSWARATGAGQQERPTKPVSKSGERPPRRDERRDDGRRDGPRDRDGGRRSPQGRGERFDDRRSGPPRNEDAPPAEGVHVILIPHAEAVHLIGREIHQVARVYPLYDVAKILLAERARCRAVFDAPEPHAPLYRGKLDESLFLTREDATRHLWQSELKSQLIEEEIIEVDPPSGNFQLVAKCGLTGLWLGPPNFHTYQTNLRSIHRECFPNMPFAAYSSKVRTERGEEAVNAWLETMKKKTRWRIKGDADDAWIDDRAEAERALATRCFDLAFQETRHAEVPASIPPKNLSPSLMTSLKIAGNHARNHPAVLIPAVCKAVEAEHLPVFKRQGKLFTGPARPHPLPPGQTLAERPGIMVEWIRANKPAKLEGLWKAVLPEGSSAPPAEFAADLFWLLHQGHILLFTDDTLVVQEIRENQGPETGTEPKAGNKKKKKSKKTKPQGELATGETAAAEAPLAEAEAPLAEAEAPLAEAEAPLAEAEAPLAEAEAPLAEAEAPASSETETSERTEDGDLSKKTSTGVDDAPAL